MVKFDNQEGSGGAGWAWGWALHWFRARTVDGLHIQHCIYQGFRSNQPGVNLQRAGPGQRIATPAGVPGVKSEEVRGTGRQAP